MKFIFMTAAVIYGAYVLNSVTLIKPLIDDCYVASADTVIEMFRFSHQQNTKEFRNAEKQLEQIAKVCQIHSSNQYN